MDPMTIAIGLLTAVIAVLAALVWLGPPSLDCRS
jgi:hypothetical protein